MRIVGRGIQEFAKLIEDDLFYVDKTGFIAEWYRKRDDVTLITRPRRFGKTLTIDMLNIFFSLECRDRRELFEGLAIGSDSQMMELQGTVPVIKVSFAGVKGETFRNFLRGIAGRISMLLDRYRYLAEDGFFGGDEKELFMEMSSRVPSIPKPETDSDGYEEYIFKLTHIFHILSNWLYRFHGKKVYIFMDEYDTPIQSAYMYGYYDRAIGIMRELFAETFKENEYLDRAVITGITRIAKESLFSDMNNVAVCSVVSGGYDKAFGFTQDEMDEILGEYGLSSEKDVIRFWYDGFTVGAETGLYNPWSIVNYLAERPKVPEDYWAKSGGVGMVDRLVRYGSVPLKEGFETLLGGGVIRRSIRDDLIFPWLDEDENSVWSLLIAAGYVKILPGAGTETAGTSVPGTVGGTGKYRTGSSLCLTNYEAQVSLSEMVSKWFSTRSGNFMKEFADALLADDLMGMNDAMQRVLIDSASSFDSGIKSRSGNARPENFFHALTLGMLTCLSDDFRVMSNRESGFGRYDVCVEPVNVVCGKPQFASIMEFKVFDEKKGDKDLKSTANRARSQIDDKGYDAELLAKGIASSDIRKYGFGFRGKKVVIVR